MTDSAKPMTGLADKLHAQIMNLPCTVPMTLVDDVTREHFLLPQDPVVRAYRVGHRDARHAAAELVGAEVEAARAALEVKTGQQDGRESHLAYVWNTLNFFACESSYTTGERTGGVLQGCPRDPPPTYSEMACYGRIALASLCRYLGRKPEDWMTVGICHPPLPADTGAAVPAEQTDARPFPEGWKSAAEKPPAPGWYERRYSDGIYAHWWSGEQWSATKDGNAHWRQLADAPYPLWRPVSAPTAPPVQPGEREQLPPNPKNCTASVDCTGGHITTKSCTTGRPLIDKGGSSDGERDYYECPDCGKQITVDYREN